MEVATNQAFEFRPPSLGFEGVTADEKRLAEKYTRIRPICEKGYPDAHTAWLIVEGQQFCVTHVGMDTAEEASWVCLQAAKAIQRLLELENWEG